MARQKTTISLEPDLLTAAKTLAAESPCRILHGCVHAPSAD